MRRFIYLDTDTLNSYLAQIYDGLAEKNQQEKQQTFETSVQNNETKFLGEEVEGKLNISFKNLKETNNTELIKDIQTKIVHDNAFDQLMGHLNSENLINKTNFSIGDFVELNDKFFVLDLDYYDGLFNSGGFIEQLKKIQANNIKEEFENQKDEELNREQKRSRQKAIEKSIKDAIEKNNAQYQEVDKIIKMFTSMVPYRKILYIGNCLVVIDEKFCRDKVELLSFKYGGEVKVVGYITNKILNEEEQKGLSVFSGVSASVNAMMKIFFDNIDELYVVHPIAIYY